MQSLTRYTLSADVLAAEAVRQLKPERVLPGSQQPLTDDEYAACLGRLAEFRRILSQRDASLNDAAQAGVLMPASNWDRRTRNYGYLDAILAGDRRRLNRLRLYTRFTGFSLFYMDYHNDRETPVDLPDDIDPILAERMPAPGAWVRRFIFMTRCHPPEMVVPPPPRFAEIGWNVRGVVVNHDTCVYQERVGLIFQSGIAAWLCRAIGRGERPVIVEIGTGFGGLAFRLAALFPEASYICVDIPESLVFASLYLGLTLPEREHRIVSSAEPLDAPPPGSITYLPNYLAFDALRSMRAALVLNTLSFSELTEAQVNGYGTLAGTMIGDTGLLFEQNQDNRPSGMIYCKTVLEKQFPHRHDMPAIDPIGTTEGVATLWANKPVLGVLAR